MQKFTSQGELITPHYACMHEKQNKPKKLAMFLLRAFFPPMSPLSLLLFNYMHPFFGVRSLIFNVPLA